MLGVLPLHPLAASGLLPPKQPVLQRLEHDRDQRDETVPIRSPKESAGPPMADVTQWQSWSSQQVGDWLDGLGGVAQKNKEYFLEADVTGEDLVECDDEMLEGIEISNKFHR